MFLKLSFFLLLIIQKTFNSNEYAEIYLKEENEKNLIKVDFMVIQNLSVEQDDHKEKWRDLDNFAFSEEALYLKEETTTLINFDGGKEYKANFPNIKIDAVQNTATESSQEISYKAPLPFLFERIPFQKEMKEIQENLDRSKDYRVLFYNSWYQPAFKKNQSLPIFIEGTKKDKRVYGEINVYKERFLHLDSKVRLSQKTPEKNESIQSPNLINFQELIENKKQKQETINKDNYWIKTIFNTVKINFENIGDYINPNNEVFEEIIFERPNFKYLDLYEINEELKLDPEAFNLVDHPYFSILIRVTEAN